MDSLLRQIVAQASAPLERLGAAYSPAPCQDEALIQARLDEWGQALDAAGGRETLHRFLKWEGLDAAAAERAVGPAQLQETTALPEWAEALGQVLKHLDLAPNTPALDHPPLPFQDLLAPWVHLFQQQRVEQAAAGCALLTPPALASLERALAARLSEIAAPTFYAEFHQLRAERLKNTPALLTDAPGQELYREFVRQMQAGGLAALFAAYPVLARLMATLTVLWTQAHVEFLQRLATDYAEIARAFQNDLGRVTTLEAGLSDPHRGAHSVIALGFESGLRLVYKPKALGVEAAYSRFLAWLNEHCPEPGLDMRVLKVLDRGTHGWVEYAEPRPCANYAEIVRYYRRAGALLCLVYLLDGTDCHADNLIASGEYPILIDNETLLRPKAPKQAPPQARASADWEAVERLEASVLYTGLLPNWRPGPGGVYDDSGLGAPVPAPPFRAAVWSRVNTDLMTLAFENVTSPPHANVPRVQVEKQLEPVIRTPEINEAIVDGFQTAYRWLLGCRENLPLALFKNQTVRFVFRDTRVYDALQKQARQPRRLQDGADYGIYLERLARAHMLTPDKPTSWPLLAAERQAMHQLDIPLFAARADQKTLILAPGQEIQNYFSQPSFERIAERLRGMSESDLAQQVEWMRISLHTQVVETENEPPGRDAESQGSLASHQTLFMAQAARLAQELMARAIYGQDGSTTWIGPQRIPATDLNRIAPLGPGLYDGLAGVALFLAAHAKISADDDARRACQAALKPIRESLGPDEFNATVAAWGLGGATGLGALLYTLARISQLLGEPAHLDLALSAAQRLTPEHITADTMLDVVGGAAGAILGLLAVYEATRHAAALQKAAACGRHLLASRAPGPAGPRAWPSKSGQLLTGFAHGAAGIAYALLRLYAATDESDFRAAAQEAIEYEASVFVEPQGNWPDLRPSTDNSTSKPGEPRFGIAWCTGATGIGLARLGGLAALDTPNIRRDLDIALAATQRALADQSSHADHLCCGNMGRIELLLAAGMRASDAGMIDTARRQASQVVRRAEQGQGYRFSSSLPRGLFAPGFFQGAAGIGYQLLRLAQPDRLASALLWE